MRDDIVIAIVITCIVIILLCMLALWCGVWPLQAANIAGIAAITICLTGVVLAIDLIIWIIRK